MLTRNNMSSLTFIIDCPFCKAKAAATENGRAERGGYDDLAEEPFGHRIYLGSCPRCNSFLVGESNQIGFQNWDTDEDYWSDIVRVFPQPSRTFSRLRISQVVKDSFAEADRSMQANANIAACAMLGRALEALCRDFLKPANQPPISASLPASTTTQPVKKTKADYVS